MKRIMFVLFVSFWAGARICDAEEASSGRADLLQARDVPGASVMAILDDGVVLESVPVLASDQKAAEHRVTSPELSNRGYFKSEADGKYYLRTSRKVFVYTDPSKYKVKDAFEKPIYPCGRYEWAQNEEKTVELRAYTTDRARAEAVLKARMDSGKPEDGAGEEGESEKPQVVSRPVFSIAIENATSSTDDKHMTFRAEVRNTGTESVKQIKVTVNWLDAEGKPLRSDSTFAVLGEDLAAGQSRQFSIISPVDDRMRGYEYGVSSE